MKKSRNSGCHRLAEQNEELFLKKLVQLYSFISSSHVHIHKGHVCVWHMRVRVHMWLMPESSMITLSTYSFLQSLSQSQLGLWIFSSLICSWNSRWDCAHPVII